MRHRISGTNDWGWQGVGPTQFLWRMVFWCATEMLYFCGAPDQVRHRNNFCGALLASAPQNCIPPIRVFLLVLAHMSVERVVARLVHSDESIESNNQRTRGRQENKAS
jgi:hypothetical protein